MEKDDLKTMALKLLVNTETGQIIYAEAGKDFVDLIFSFLLLPIGSVVKLLSISQGLKRIGSVTNLYESMDKLPSVLMQADKSELLSPKVPPNFSSSALRIDYGGRIEHGDTYYVCGNNRNGFYSNSGVRRTTATHSMSKRSGETCGCGHTMNYAVQLAENASEGIAKTNNKVASEGSSGSGGYVKETVTFLITDDLKVMPTSTIACITLLNRLNIKDISLLEERNTNVGPNETLELLWASLVSKTALNDVFRARLSASARRARAQRA